MSNPESFIDEVTEEVRRDKLYAAFRKYGWIGVLIVLGVVGGTAWTEWRKSSAETAAMAFGDAVMAATELQTPAERRAALDAIQATGDRAMILDMMRATDPAEDREATLAALARVEADAKAPQAWRDLATLRRVLVQGKDLALADRRAALESLARPGGTFRTLAAEQLAYLLVEEGKTADAIKGLEALLQDQEATQSLRARARQMIIALGGEIAAG